MLVGLSKHRRLKRKTPPQQQRGPRAHTTQSRDQTLTHLQKQRSSEKFNGQTHAVFLTTASRGSNGCMESAWPAQEVLVAGGVPRGGRQATTSAQMAPIHFISAADHKKERQTWGKAAGGNLWVKVVQPEHAAVG